jgi:hypothetical protein
LVLSLLLHMTLSYCNHEQVHRNGVHYAATTQRTVHAYKTRHARRAEQELLTDDYRELTAGKELQQSPLAPSRWDGISTRVGSAGEATKRTHLPSSRPREGILLPAAASLPALHWAVHHRLSARRWRMEGRNQKPFLQRWVSGILSVYYSSCSTCVCEEWWRQGS